MRRHLIYLLGSGLLSLACALPAAAATGLKIYADELDVPVLSRVTYGYDRDAVCTRGRCANGTTVCLRNNQCTGIGDGLCHFTACTADFNLCDDGTTLCGSNADCSGIGSGTCNANPCAPPNEICGVKVDSLIPGAPVEQTIWELVCNPTTLPAGTTCQVGVALPATTVSWDFSSFNTATYSDLKPRASTFVEIETPEFEPGGDNSGDCGFDPGDVHPKRILNREDQSPFTPARLVPTLSSIERQNDVRVCTNGKICVNAVPDCNGIGDGSCTSTATIWQRGVVRFEGIDSPTLGAGESRLCFTDDDGNNRTETALWRFPNQDADGYFMRLGDPRWQHTAFNCEPVILSPSSARVKASTGYEGKQTGEVVNEGLVKLPSGHQFQSLVARTIAEYQVSINFLGTCNIPVDTVRTVLYLWEVPHLGTVVRLQSDKTAADDGATPAEFVVRHLSEVDIKYGLFPPLTLNVTGVTGSSADISWNPGAVTSHISGYRVYWGEESGGACSIGGEDCTTDHPGAGNCPAGQTCCGTPGAVCIGYERDSISDPGMVAFNAGCALAAGDTQCARISSLDPATTYYLTVTARSNFADPQSGVVTTYESLRYPTQAPAVPVDLPIEVSATTSGGSAAGSTPDGNNRPGTPLRVDKSGAQISVSWGSSCQVSDTDYELYEGVLGNFSGHVPVTCSTGGATATTFAPGIGDRFYLAVPRNGSREGSYGLRSSGAERPLSPAACLLQDIGAPVCP